MRNTFEGAAVRESGARSLRAFLPPGEPCATLHDATVLGADIDPAGGAGVIEMSIYVGCTDDPDPQARERERKVRMTVEGLRLWESEQPLAAGAWLTSDGPIAEVGTERAAELAAQLDPDAGWYLYFADTNSFVYFDAVRIGFEWIGE